nr:MAG TPA: hypothetical protein [Caudoviricetes sp.]
MVLLFVFYVLPYAYNSYRLIHPYIPPYLDYLSIPLSLVSLLVLCTFIILLNTKENMNYDSVR